MSLLFIEHPIVHPVMEEPELIFFGECLDNCRTYLEFGGGGSTYMVCGNIRYKYDEPDPEKRKANRPVLMATASDPENPLINVKPYTTLESSRLEKIYSVEHDKEWVERTAFCIRADFGEEALKGLKMYHVPINETGLKTTYDNEDPERAMVGESLEYDWGHFNDPDSLAHIKYQSYINEINEKVDLIFIDGRYRAATALNCIKWCHFNSPNTKILMHDYGPKPGEDFDWRPQYNVVEKFLDKEESVQNLYLFNLKDGKSWTYQDLDSAIENSKNDPT